MIVHVVWGSGDLIPGAPVRNDWEDIECSNAYVRDGVLTIVQVADDVTRERCIPVGRMVEFVIVRTAPRPNATPPRPADVPLPPDEQLGGTAGGDCSYRGCGKPTAYLPVQDRGSVGYQWRHVNPEDETGTHVGYPMPRKESS